MKNQDPATEPIIIENSLLIDGREVARMVPNEQRPGDWSIDMMFMGDDAVPVWGRVENGMPKDEAFYTLMCLYPMDDLEYQILKREAFCVGPRFAIDETVYMESRYDGIVQRRITKQIYEDGLWPYALDRSIGWNKDGARVGSAVDVPWPREGKRNDLFDRPVPQSWLMKIGDPIMGTHQVSGGVQEEKLTLDDVNLEEFETAQLHQSGEAIDD
jgi:hypothetical protein